MYIVSIGSNIKPSHHVTWVVQHMNQAFGELIVSRFFQTQAFLMVSRHSFWNGVVMFSSDLPFDELKKLLSDWEVESGRNRNHPQCSIRDRTLDLDILWQDQSGWLDSIKELKGLPYIWYPMCSLLGLRAMKPRLGTVWFMVGCELLGGKRKRLR